MVIVTFLAAFVSSAIFAFMTIYTNMKNEKERFDLQLQNISSYSIKYPYLGQRTFADTWDPSLVNNDEKYQRYEAYCIMIFNFIYDVYVWKKHKRRKVENYIGIRSWLEKHKKYWNNPPINSENNVYGDDFKKFVGIYITNENEIMQGCQLTNKEG